MRLVETTRFRRRNLPHWEVKAGRYFVTVRCAGSLPFDVVARLSAVEYELAKIQPRSASYLALQRRYFTTVEQYLDSTNKGVLADAQAANVVASQFQRSEEIAAEIPHFAILPNHWHAVVIPHPGIDLAAVMKRIKGRTGCKIRQVIGGRGPVWQREWFDRWVRNEVEWQRCGAYIRNNPVKAGLVTRWQDHAWTR